MEVKKISRSTVQRFEDRMKLQYLERGEPHMMPKPAAAKTLEQLLEDLRLQNMYNYVAGKMQRLNVMEMQTFRLLDEEAAGQEISPTPSQRRDMEWLQMKCRHIHVADLKDDGYWPRDEPV